MKKSYNERMDDVFEKCMEAKKKLVDELKIEYRDRTGGHGCFFDHDTMKFFKSKIEAVKVIGKIWYFVTSEKPPYGNRSFTVRKMNAGGSITNVSVLGTLTEAAATKMLDEI